MINVLYFYINIFPSMCELRSTAFFLGGGGQFRDGVLSSSVAQIFTE